MQLSSAIGLFASLFTLVAGEACVVSGPNARVDAGEACCYFVKGKWFQNFDAQGICVFAQANLGAYDKCFDYKYNVTESTYAPTCIVCDETTDCGLTT